GLGVGGVSLVECQEKFITSRRLGDLIPLPSWLGIIGEWLNNEVNIPGVFQFGKLGQTRLLTYNNPNVEKLTRAGLSSTHPRNYIRDWKDGIDPALGMMAQGDNMGSDDLYWMKFGPEGFGPFTNPLACKDNEKNILKCWGDPRKGYRDGGGKYMPYQHMMKTSIWAMNEKQSTHNDGGVHWRIHPDQNPTGDNWLRRNRPKGPEAAVGVTRTKVCAIPAGLCPFGKGEMDVYTANVQAAQDGNHPWKGVIPFMHFEPGQFEGVCGRTAGEGAAPRYKFDFNQPSTWVALNKSPDEITNKDLKDKEAGTNAPALLNAQKKVNFKFASENDELVLENNRKKFLSFSEGLNVITRGQTYYHRPGNWTEHPNFFNPYWRPRLASVYQGRHNLPLAGQLNDALPGPLKNIAPKIITH
ncbi:hypothetical protein HPC49_38435, partial [Pyxidicoccus fallax]|nr:hypothetical protein [Pyxidicoccus fallax]